MKLVLIGSALLATALAVALGSRKWRSWMAARVARRWNARRAGLGSSRDSARFFST